MKDQEYIERFFEEKEIPYKLWNITDSQGLNHTIDNEVVIEHIKKCQGKELNKIVDILRKIDFANGDVNHFFRHLANGLCEQYEGVLR